MAKRTNKQRLTLLTKKERRSTSRSGWVDETLPDKQIEQRLLDEPGVIFDARSILDVLAYEVGLVRLLEQSEDSRLEPNEIAHQARQTADVIQELMERLEHMHFEIEAKVDATLVRSFGESVLQIREDLRPRLSRLMVLTRKVASEIERAPVRTGPKHRQRDLAKAHLTAALRANSDPPVGARRASALASDVLAITGVSTGRSSPAKST